MTTLPPSFDFDAPAQRLCLSTQDLSFVRDPYPAYAALHAASGPDGPVFHWQSYGHMVFGGLEAVNALFRDKRLGRQAVDAAPMADHLSDFAAVEARSLLELDPPDHTRLRAAVNRAFVPRRIEAMRDAITADVHGLLDGLEHATECDLIADFAQPFAGDTILELIGIDTKHTKKLVGWSNAIVAMYQAQRSTAEERRANEAARAFASFVDDTISVMKNQDVPEGTSSPLLKLLIDETDLTEQELVSTTILLLNAGHEATVHAMGHAFLRLLETSQQQRSIWLANPKTFVEECLRHTPPLHMFHRYVREDCTLYGAPLKRGDIVGLHIGLANCDPRATPNPDVFDPERSPIKQVAFGAGIHFCIGHMLARLEMEIALPLFFQRFGHTCLLEQPRIRNAYHFHGLETVRVRLESAP